MSHEETLGNNITMVLAIVISSGHKLMTSQSNMTAYIMYIRDVIIELYTCTFLIKKQEYYEFRKWQAVVPW